MTTLTYFEPLEAGHCAFWARMTLLAAARDPRVSRLRLVTGAEMADRLSDVITTAGPEVTVLDETAIAALRQDGLMARGRAQWAAARAQLDGVGGQLFLPFMDHAVYGAVLDRAKVEGQISGIIFRPPNTYNYPLSVGRLKQSTRRWGSYLAAQRPELRRLFSLDEYAPRAAISRMAGLLTFLPDPTPDLSLLENRARQPRADGGTVYLLFGALAERKGIFALLDALGHLPADSRAGLVLRFVGRIDPADRSRFMAHLAQVQSACPEAVIELVDDFVSDETLAQEVVDCDVVLAPYQNHIGSSGVVFWAAAAGKPLIAQNTGMMGYQIAEHDLGLTVNTTDPLALALALDRTEARPRNAAFLAAHTPDRFTDTILEGLLA
ncbi:glycosyltransferase [Puniceibacterium confluentis]|uniref:glycosyltransferase n=1 Tax=Puniceibacterium confluentis TaxID=1958944 RepID=UPI0011B7735E|nr:glycosyltransferase [Puniceibacterium confluentis]